MEGSQVRSLLFRYFSGQLPPLAVAAVVYLTWPFFEHSPVALFFGAVAVSAWFGGTGPGLLSVATSFLEADYFFIAPYSSFWPIGRGNLADPICLVGMGGLVSLLSGRLKQAFANVQVTRDRAEREVASARISESKLSGIIDSAMDAIITVDSSFRITVFNRAAERMFRCSPEEAIGRPLDRFIPERFRAAHDGHIQAFGRTGVSTRAMASAREIFGLRADGSEFPLEASISQVEAPGERFFTVILRDVTENREAEKRFRQVIENAPNGMVMVDGAGKISLANLQMERSFGYARDELIGQPIELLIPHRFHQHHPKFREDFTAHPAARPMGSGRDLYGRRKDGTEFPVEVGLNPIQTDAGIAVLGTIVDITERKLAEERLRASESRLSAIIESARDAIITVDRQQRIQVFNRTAEIMFRCPASEALGSSLDRFIPERFRATHSSHIQAFGDTGVSTRTMAGSREIFGLRTDGTEFPVEASISQIEAEGQKLFTVILRDVTEHRRAEERFRQVIEHAPNGMVMVDGAAAITLVNAQIEKSFGYRRDESIGQPIEILIPERFHQDHPKYRNEFIAHPAARPMGSGRDLFGRRKDGTEFPVEIGLNPVETETGPMILGTVVDITERKQIEDALRSSERRLRIVTDNARVGLVMVNRDRCYTFANNAYAEILDLPSADIVGRPVNDVLGSMYEEQVAPKLDRAFEGERVTYELHRQTPGSYRHYAVSYEPMQTETAETLVVVVITDITERKQAEEELARQRAQLRVIFDSITDGIVVLDRERNIVEANPAGRRLQELTAYPREDAGYVIVGNDNNPLPLDMWPSSRALRGDFVRDHELALRNQSDGTLVNLEVTSAPVTAASLSTGQIMLTTRDVTQRKQAEEQLREQAEMLAFAPVLVRDLNDRVLFWNTGATRMYGWSASEAIGRVSHELLGTKFPQTESAITQALHQHHHWEGELIHTCKDGREIVVVSNWILHRDREGTPKAIIEFNSDITAQKDAEREVRRLNTELESRVAQRTAELTAVNKELEAFSYSVSHDLRAPLRHINGFSLALLEDYGDRLEDEGKTYLNEVRAASQEMAQLIDDVLQLARVTRSEMTPELVDISGLAHKVIATLRKQDPEREVELEIEPGLAARGDKRLLEIALMNLLANAWKFTSRSTNARIKMGRTLIDNEPVFYVRDNGAGFDGAFSDKLFRAFQRLHTGAEFEGTGIGLATVQRILNRHGGRVWAHGAVNQGATFFFTLPLQ